MYSNFRQKAISSKELFADRLEEEGSKFLSISYEKCEKNISGTIDIHIKIISKKLENSNANIGIFYKDTTSSNILLTTTNQSVNRNGETTIIFKIFNFQFKDLTTKTDYCLGITVDNLFASTNYFTLECLDKDIFNIFQSCFCNRDFTVDEFKNIVVELRKSTFYDSKTIEYYHQNKLFYKEPLLNDNEKNNFQLFTWVINQAFNKFKINTCIRKINFIAQMYPETGYFTDLSENNPSSSLGKYYGRGFIQLTHKGKEDVRTKNADSYLGYAKYSKLDIISDPDLLCKSLSIAADSGGWFWRFGKLLQDGSIKDLNSLADIDDVNEISRLVNGGKEAIKERLEANKKLKKIMNYEKCNNKK